MTTTTISEFRANAKKYIVNIISDNGALIINRGNTAAVLISLEEYNSIKATESVLASQVVTDNLTNGIEHWKNGQRIEVDIDSL